MDMHTTSETRYGIRSLIEHRHLIDDKEAEALVLEELKRVDNYIHHLESSLEDITERVKQMQADRRWLAEQLVDALGKSSQGKYLMPPKDGEHPVADKETAVKAWVEAAQEAGKRKAVMRNTMSWEEWKTELVRLAGGRYGPRGAIAECGEQCWWDAYDERFTPQEALNEDMRNA